MAPREAARLVRTLAEAVEYAHQKGVLHRDLKPGNILLDGDATPKITDFGLARLLPTSPDETAPPSLTETDAVVGTASYMAPEQAEGRAPAISTATDIYALGAILYECLAGRPPFVGPTKIKILELVRSAPAVPPSRYRSGVPGWLEAICLKCLEKRPSHRYPSAQALADDLGHWLSDERPRGVPGRLVRMARFARRRAGVVLLVIAATMAAAALISQRPRTAAREDSGPVSPGIGR
jgi:serine/threonine-protein kinase